jgi:1,2-diacylglycerol 3-beta-galactosyltransferase
MGKRLPGSLGSGLRRFRFGRSYRDASAQLYRGDAALGPKRFLFLFSDTGGGHRASAQAVKDEMARLYGASVSVEMIDLFIELDQWPFDRFPAWYPTCVGLNGIPWGVGFHLSDDKRLVGAMSRLVWPYARAALCDFLQRYPADVIVSFHPIPNHTLLMALRYLGLQTSTAIVTLDMVTAHAGWFARGADLYTVPTQAAKARALRRGLPEDRIVVTGMPTRRSFLQVIDLPKADARLQLGLPPELPVVLIVGGGEGMGPLAQVVRAIARCRPRAHIVVVTGRNRVLYEELACMDLPVRIQVEGFVSNMEVWMRAADILVTKAGPNTLSEAFVAGLPVVLYAALPGQEQGNVQHVIENGAGYWAPLPKQAARAVIQLLDEPDVRRAMEARSVALARPFATEQIARSLWGLAYIRPESYQELMAQEYAVSTFG